MPTFDPSTIDPTKPTTGTALTADVRANEDATQTNLEGAFNDVAALEATAPTTDQKAALDAANLPTALNEFSTAADTDGVQTNLDTHEADLANPHSVTAVQAGADPSGSAAAVQANLDTHVADLANPHVVTAAQAGAIPLTLTADGELLSHDGIQYTKIGLGLDGQVPTARPGGGVGSKVVWEDPTGGGGASPLTTKGDLFSYDTDDARLPVGTSGQFLSVNPATATGLEYVDPPSGTGDVTSTLDTVDGEVQLGDATAKGIKGAGFQGSNLALLDAANVFLANQAVQTTAVNDFELVSTTAGINLRYLPGNGTPDQRSFRMTANNGIFTFAPMLDDGSAAAAEGLKVQHAGGATMGAPTGGFPAKGAVNAEGLQVNGLDVYSPNNPPPGGTGDVTSALDTVDGEIQLGAATAKGIKGLARAAVDLPLISNGTAPGVGPSWAQIVTGGIEDAAVTFAKMQNFAGETLLLRGLGSGPPTDTKISALLNQATPIGTDYLLVETAAGLLRHITVDQIPGGSGDVTSASDTLDDEVQVGAAGANKGVQGAGFLGSAVVRNDATATIGEVGYPYTSTAVASGGTFAPTGAGNGKYHLTGVTATTIDPSALGAESQVTIFVPAAVAVTISPAADVLKGTDPGGIRTLMIERFDVPGATSIATWN